VEEREVVVEDVDDQVERAAFDDSSVDTEIEKNQGANNDFSYQFDSPREGVNQNHATQGSPHQSDSPLKPFPLSAIVSPLVCELVGQLTILTHLEEDGKREDEVDFTSEDESLR